jgi:hypothetical protein
MKRLIALMLSVIVAVPVSLALSISVSASSMSPDIICSSQCISDGEWGNIGTTGNVHGVSTSVTFSNPNLSLANGHWQRWIEVDDEFPTRFIRAGIDKEGSPGDGPCAYQGGNKLYVFAQFNSPTALCGTTSDSSNINKQLTIQLRDYNLQPGCTNGEEVDFTFANGLSIDDCESDQTRTWSQYSYWEGLDYAYNWNTHLVWGSQWLTNQWLNQYGYWSYQGEDFTFRVAADPPQFYWQCAPNVCKYGGTLYSCDYPGGTTCTLGG